MLISHGDILLIALTTIGLFQFFWLSVFLIRKGFNPSLVRLSMVSLLSIWVLTWPAYDDTTVVLATLFLFVLPVLFALQKNNAFARHLRLGWHDLPPKTKQPAPWLMIIISLFITVELFHIAPELGFGLGLSFCLAWSAAEFIDKSRRGVRLGLTQNLQQTLAGHLIFIMLTSFICAWALQLYHNTHWLQFFVATLIVGLVGSIIRALIPAGWNMPLSMLGMSITLWLL